MKRARRTGLVVLALLVAASYAAGDRGASAGAAAGPAALRATQCLVLSGRAPLPADLQGPRDLRWSGAGEVVVSDADAGVFSWKLGAPAEPGEQWVAASRGGDQIRIPWELARSERYLAVGGAVYELGWRAAGGAPRVGVDGKAAYEAVFDLDLSGTELLVLAARWDEPTRDGFVSDGALAWVGDLSRGHETLRPTFYSAQGKGAKNAANCILAGLGRARFLEGGSYVIVPQFEEGVYLYGADGRLERTWKGAELGLDVGCEMSKEEAEHLALDEPARWAWVNARRTVDEILPTPEGFALFVRNASVRGTSWSLVRVARGGRFTTCTLPLTSASPHAHLRADVRAGELALLLFSLEREARPGADLPTILLGAWP